MKILIIYKTNVILFFCKLVITQILKVAHIYLHAVTNFN